MSRINEVLDRPLARRGAPSFTETLIEPLARLRGEVDRLFDDFPARWPTVRFTLPTGLLVPAVEMTETKRAYKLNIEVPGMDATDIEMHVHDGAILISGEKKERREEDEKGYAYSERSFGAFERRIELPPGADEKGIKAKVRNGVLEIVVPKKPEAAGERKRIEIESD
jgi:HSP20 family protein